MKALIKSYFSLMSLLFLTSSVYAQGFFITYTPANPCVSDSVHFSTSIPSNPIAPYRWTIDNLLITDQEPVFLFTTPGYHGVTVWSLDSLQGLAFVDSIGIFIDSICPTNNITGMVFNDANNNGIFDTGEQALNNKAVTITPGNYTAFSNQSGIYSLNVHAGIYDVELQVPTYWAQSLPSAGGNYSVTFPGNGGSSTGNDFGLHSATNIQDLEVYLVCWPARPGFDQLCYLSYLNVGTASVSATLDFTHDSNQSFVSSNPAEDSYSANTSQYVIGNLNPGDAGVVAIVLHTDTTVALGMAYSHSAILEPLASDTTPANNVDTASSVVVGSFDPNDKQVSPGSTNVEGTIPQVGSLEYTIRFQNSGTFLAENVRVEDVIDTDLDLTALHLLSASHPYEYQIDMSTRKITWFFNQINLPDSNTNEEASHGYIRFRIGVDYPNPKPETVEVQNVASIYFDFNEAIVTNLVTSLLKEETVGFKEPEMDQIIYSHIFPNPFLAKTYLGLSGTEGPFSLRVYDLNGQEVLKLDNQVNLHLQIDLEIQPSGLYFYEVRNSENQTISRGKMVKQDQ